MWALYHENGELFRDGFPTQWDAVRTARKADGTAYKKVETLALTSGTEVYRAESVTFVKDIPPIIGMTGQYGASQTKKITQNIRKKMILREVLA